MIEIIFFNLLLQPAIWSTYTFSVENGPTTRSINLTCINVYI